MKVESLDDVLTIDLEKLKSPDKTKLLTRIKQLIKLENKTENSLIEDSSLFPYEGVSVVGNKYVEIRFDLNTKKARVTDVRQDTRDTDKRNYMCGAEAVKKVIYLTKKQREIKNG